MEKYTIHHALHGHTTAARVITSEDHKKISSPFPHHSAILGPPPGSGADPEGPPRRPPGPRCEARRRDAAVQRRPAFVLSAFASACAASSEARTAAGSSSLGVTNVPVESAIAPAHEGGDEAEKQRQQYTRAAGPVQTHGKPSYHWRD